MLQELKIANFAIIHALDVQFGSGLNILSGETGAGKSVLLKGLGLLMGAKADTDVVRTGSAQASVEGLFDLKSRPDIRDRLGDLGIEMDEDTLIVRRLLSAEGKSKIYLNGTLAPLSHLRDLVSPLITVTGANAPLIELTAQHDNRNLQSPAYHLDLLDHYAGLTKLRDEYASLFSAWRRMLTEFTELSEAARQREQRLDFLRYQLEEIRSVAPQSGEDEDLRQQIQRLRHSAKLADFASETEASLYGEEGAVNVRLHQVLQRALELKSLDPEIASKVEPLAQAKTLVEDVVYELREYARGLSGDGSGLEELEERLSQIRRLQKKFGESIPDILAEQQSMTEEVARLDTAEDRLNELKGALKAREDELRAKGANLHQRRSGGAELLTKSINAELAELNMKGAVFGVSLRELEELTATGTTHIEFTLAPGKKEAPRPLAKIASGGELSRVLLAIKCVVGQSEFPRTYLFDEVDAGVSGQTAERVGRKLKSIAEHQQVICVTHLPQVAAFADRHFLIEKTSARNGAEMKIQALNASDRVAEIARLISGEKVSKTSLEHARQLIQECQV